MSQRMFRISVAVMCNSRTQLRLRGKYFLASFAIFTLAMPAWAHKYKTSLAFDQNETIKGVPLKPGSYQFAADDAKKDLNILQNGKVIATVRGQWVKLPKKPRYSSSVSNGSEITQLQFSGSGQAFQLRSYSSAEYAAFNAADKTADPVAKVKALDDFIASHPNSALLPYVYVDHYKASYELKNYLQTLEYIDKLLALGDGVTAERLQALVMRSQTFVVSFGDKILQTPEQFKMERDAAAQGLQALAAWKKPDKMDLETFTITQKNVGKLFGTAAGMAESGLKDYVAAQASYKAALALDPNDAVTTYRLGIAYLQSQPQDPQSGYWGLARSVALKVPSDDKVRLYLRNQMLHYQQPHCDNLVDGEIDQLVTLAATASDRPSTLSVPSADDLKKAHDDTTNFISWLMEGGNHANTMWLATCGSQYNDVAVRVMEVIPGEGDNITLKVFYAPTDVQMQAATAPNMEIHVVGQPEARRIQKDDYVRFTGTLTGYARSPFLLTWDTAKVKALLFSADNQATFR